MTVAESGPSDSYVVGVDGCPGGWVAVELRADQWAARVFKSFAELAEFHDAAACIGVDIPIGLKHGGVRACDTAARKMIKPRGSCVFNPPDPRILDCSTHAEAMSLLRELGLPGVSKQTMAILPKIAEVDAYMTPDRQSRIVEVHPEVSFCALNDIHPILIKKARTAGYDIRAALLREKLGLTIGTRREMRVQVEHAKPDDVLDAIVAAWSARRMVNGVAKRLPEISETNADGLRMEIVY